MEKSTMEHDTIGEDMQTDGAWNEFTGRVEKAYGDITGDELKQFKGNAREAMGYVQRKTGETLESVKGKLGWNDENKEES